MRIRCAGRAQVVPGNAVPAPLSRNEKRCGRTFAARANGLRKKLPHAKMHGPVKAYCLTGASLVFMTLRHASGRFPYGAVFNRLCAVRGHIRSDNRRFFEHSAERRTFFCTVSKEHS